MKFIKCGTKSPFLFPTCVRDKFLIKEINDHENTIATISYFISFIIRQLDHSLLWTDGYKTRGY
jgi:hypothetical protein